jgi:hypothetical protein
MTGQVMSIMVNDKRLSTITDIPSHQRRNELCYISTSFTPSHSISIVFELSCVKDSILHFKRTIFSGTFVRTFTVCISYTGYLLFLF